MCWWLTSLMCWLVLNRQSSGWQSGHEAFGQPPPSFPSCSDSEQTGCKGCRQFTYMGDQVSLCSFIMVTILNLKVVVKMMAMMMVLAVKGVMVVIFFYRCVDVALWTEAQQRAGGDILKPGINIKLIYFGRIWPFFIKICPFFCCWNGIECLFKNIITLHPRVHCWMCERRKGRRLKIFSDFRLIQF